MIWTGPCSAGYFDDTAHDFYNRCTGTERQVICYATAGAYLDMMIALGYKCQKDTGVNRQQVADILVKYLRDHPEDRSDPLVFQAIFAFQKALVCKQVPPKPQ